MPADETAEFQYDYLIISAHGDEGKICMPELAEQIYEADEPRGDLNADTVEAHLKIKGKVIISLCCTGGMEPMATVFQGTYLYRSSDYIDGNAALYSISFLKPLAFPALLCYNIPNQK